MALSYKEQLQHPNWQRKRLEIFERDLFSCQICEETEKQLQIHHLYYLPNYLVWEYDNECYVTLCNKCHNVIQFDMAKVAGLIAFEIMKGLNPIQIKKVIELIKQT